MRKILSVMALAAVLAFSGCDKESEDNSFVTLLPTVELKGDEVVVLNLGDSYTDAGADVELDGVPRTDFSVDGSVDTSEPDLYQITYTMVNEDGYSVSATRDIYVTDPTFQTKWFCKVNVKRDGSIKLRGLFVYFEKLDDTHIKCEDLLGGYYLYGAGYGPMYAASGVIEISEPDADGWAEITGYTGGEVAAWGDAIKGVSGKINVKDGKFHFTVPYDKYVFEPLCE